MGAWQGREEAEEYLAGYLIERSLSIDNIFVFALIFASFAIPMNKQGRLLSIGIVMALVMRAIFIIAGAALLDAFHFTIYLFGLLLVATGIKLARHSSEEVHPERNIVLRGMKRIWPGTTVTAAVVVVLATTDLIFAIDSIPAIFAITEDPFIVFAANAFALLGLRSLYFLLAGMMDRFAYLTHGLAIVLIWVGAKMLLTDIWKVPTWLSLLVIISVLAGAIGLSFFTTRGTQPEEPGRGTAMTTWTFLSHHAQVFLCIARDPDVRLRDIAAAVGITERAVQAIVNDLVAEGYVDRTRVGRRNHYSVHADVPLRHRLQGDLDAGTLLTLLR